MDRIIIHVDMDAFYASVEIRDNPSLRGKPVIVGAMPDQRGVVATCSYEAREYGVRSGMNIKEAYRLCPEGVYLTPNFDKYREVSRQLHGIWDSYASASEPIALDEAFLDVTGTAGDFDRAAEMAREIKRRTAEEVGLTCSVGLSYCKAAAKAASEEIKPNGYYELRTREEFVELMRDRDVRELFSVGPKTAERLHDMGVHTVGDLAGRRRDVESLLGKHGRMLTRLAEGIDDREVVPYNPEDAKSVSREITFQRDVSDYSFLLDVILLLSLSVEERASRYGLHGSAVNIKVTYSDMKCVVKTRSGLRSDDALSVSRMAWDMLLKLPRKPVRLVGVGISGISERRTRQTTLFGTDDRPSDEELVHYLELMRRKYRFDFVRNRDWIVRSDSIHGVVEHMRIQRSKASAAGVRRGRTASGPGQRY
ncbi:MAG: DNA polymerase IV [Candidatus Methanomethylophilaceae archaeon]|nr:DNA polymerase IV [Candidatus Methanomethylophilaceae archaeon]